MGGGGGEVVLVPLTPRLAAPWPLHARRLLRTRAKPGWTGTTPRAGLELRGVQIAARHADPCTTTRHDRARKGFDRHPNDTLAADLACGT
jgi:hypothetical protein